MVPRVVMRCPILRHAAIKLWLLQEEVRKLERRGRKLVADLEQKIQERKDEFG